MKKRIPLPLGIPAALAVTFLLLPLAGVLAHAPWSSLPSRLASHEVTQALTLSLLVSGWALLIALLLGVPLAWLLARTEFPGKSLVRCLVMLPMVLPPTVAGVALLQAYGRHGILGPALASYDITLPFSTAGAVMASAFVAMPFLVISLEGSLAGLHPRYEETATSLGAAPLRVFRTITLPMVLPGLIAGAALSWARALGEFGATITFAGNLPGTTQTLPLQVYLLLQDDPEGATAVSLLLLAIATAILISLRGSWLNPQTPTKTGRGRGAGEGPARGVKPYVRPSAGHTTRGPATAAHTAAPEGPPRPPGPAPTPHPLRTTVTGAVEATLNAPAGTTIAVVGPNGAGKTTLLRTLLGLTTRATATTLTLGTEDASHAPPHHRRIAWVPQDGALFPHLTALANTAYGLRAQGTPRAEAHREARQWLDRLGVGALAHHRPGRLSGGQAQRVALARALAARPRLLLLDEPLAALDQSTRTHVRHTLRTHLADFPGVCLLVTHDPVEAVSLASHVLVLENGRTVQYATPTDLTRRPRSPWVARMLGRNAWPGRTTADGDGTVLLDDGARLTTAEPPPAATTGLAVVPPEAVSLHTTRPTGSPRNIWQGKVREITAQGGRLRVLVEGTDGAPETVAEITPSAAADLALAEGTPVWASIKATEAAFIPL
ncbi:ABC transporter permease [Streptomyces morookaense]|uniref:ABC transporter permease n=1 Tax=Streptomyces morookaense TaxID=1970 RepID=UPI00280AF387|nr:ABC transporter permease [Streptomyces morookaense]